MSKKKIQWKKVIATGIVTTSLGIGFWASKAFYTVTSVIDGDTFITSEKQYIRLDSVNAPEIGYCLGEESKKELENLVLNKKVFIKVNYIDGMRLIASAYTSKGNVGQLMLSKGMATFADKGTQKGSNLHETANKARDAKIGVYSPICTQDTNPDKPNCNIKGNVINKRLIYHIPECNYYKNTQVQLHLGDKWFCTESEARRAGFTKATNCP